MDVIAIIISAFSLLLLIFLVLNPRKNDFNLVIESVRQLLQSELKENRTELSDSLKKNRTELSNGLDNLTKSLEDKLWFL